MATTMGSQEERTHVKDLPFHSFDFSSYSFERDSNKIHTFLSSLLTLLV